MADAKTADTKTGAAKTTDTETVEKARQVEPSRNGARMGGLEREGLHGLLYRMLLARRFEEKSAESYALGKIGGFCHLYIGQEAVGVGAISVLRPEDYVVTAYRDHAQALAKGMGPREVMAELYGRIDGCSKGKGGSMHMYDRETNFLGG